MPTIRSHERKSSSEVLSRLSEFGDLAAKLAPVGRVRELYQRVRDNSGGFQLDNLLVLVDLRQTEPAVLERYMGREGLTRFRQYHGL